MQKIFDAHQITAAMASCPHRAMLKSLEISPFLIRYCPGEFISAPWMETCLFQILVSGEISIYYVRDDGSRYALANGSAGSCIGKMELYTPSHSSVFSQAVNDVVCIAFPISGNEEKLMNNNLFLRLISRNIALKLAAITIQDAAPCSLTERVTAYMLYKCPDHLLKGLEKSAFHLHCSVRQLQRILNSLTEDGTVQKVGKGAYRLTEK